MRLQTTLQTRLFAFTQDLEGVDHALTKPIGSRDLDLVIQRSLSARRSAA